MILFPLMMIKINLVVVVRLFLFLTLHLGTKLKPKLCCLTENSEELIYWSNLGKKKFRIYSTSFSFYFFAQVKRF